MSVYDYTTWTTTEKPGGTADVTAAGEPGPTGSPQARRWVSRCRVLLLAAAEARWRAVRS